MFSQTDFDFIIKLILCFSCVRNQERSEAIHLSVMRIFLFWVLDELPEEFRIICQSE